MSRKLTNVMCSKTLMGPEMWYLKKRKKKLTHNPWNSSKKAPESWRLMLLTHTYTHTLPAAHTLHSLQYTMSHVKSPSYSRDPLGSMKNKSPCVPVPKHPGQMVYKSSLEETKNTDDSWTAPFRNWKETED